MSTVRGQLERGIADILIDYGYDGDSPVIEDVIEFVCDVFGISEEREELKWTDEGEGLEG